MRVDEFDFELHPDRIALRPVSPRDAARLLVVRGGGLEDRIVRDLPGLLRRGDVVVFNDTRVIPAALTGQRSGRGGTSPRIETLLHLRLDDCRWKAFARPGKKLVPGDRIRFGSPGRVCRSGTLEATVEEKGEAGEITLAFDIAGPVLDEAISALGDMPLPPYIAGKRATDEQDRSDYQTVFAKREGAVAAPTAGLHFTSDLMKSLQEAEITTEFVTLHVGAGTFLPVKAEDTRQHRIHAEWGEVSAAAACRLRTARAAGGRVVAIGTTSLRILETSGLQPFSGTTEIFITPGHRFRAVDILMTNFHLPRSTLFMLVCAFAGTETMKSAYAHAIGHEYRFYSYGDACLLFHET